MAIIRAIVAAIVAIVVRDVSIVRRRVHRRIVATVGLIEMIAVRIIVIVGVRMDAVGWMVQIAVIVAHRCHICGEGAAMIVAVVMVMVMMVLIVVGARGKFRIERRSTHWALDMMRITH